MDEVQWVVVASELEMYARSLSLISLISTRVSNYCLSRDEYLNCIKFDLHV